MYLFVFFFGVIEKKQQIKLKECYVPQYSFVLLLIH